MRVMTNIHPIMTRMAYVTTENNGGSLDVTTHEGVLQARRIDPHGVIVVIGTEKVSIRKEDLATIGRFFLAAALLLGQDVNEGWDGQ